MYVYHLFTQRGVGLCGVRTTVFENAVSHNPPGLMLRGIVYGRFNELKNDKTSYSSFFFFFFYLRGLIVGYRWATGKIVPRLPEKELFT